jgi:hypothetical protein
MVEYCISVCHPILQLLTIEGSTWFDGYHHSLDAVWETALPITELEGQEPQSVAG